MFNASFHRQGSVKQTKIMQLIRERELRRREYEAQPDLDSEHVFDELSFDDDGELDVSNGTTSALHSLYTFDTEARE